MFARFILLLSVATCLVGCDEDEAISGASNIRVLSSADTISFDTVFTSRGSITQRFTLLNRNNQAVRLDRLWLDGGDVSPFDLVIGGRRTTDLTDVVLFGGDSLLVLVEVTIDPLDEDLPFLVQDEFRFSWNGNESEVLLQAFGQDAIRVESDTLCNVSWTAERPYLISELLYIPPGCTWDVAAGTRIFMDGGAAIVVDGRMEMNGLADSVISIRNSRLDINEAPGQWEGIFLREGSGPHGVRYTNLENGEVGFSLAIAEVDGVPDLVLQQVDIRHMSSAGLLAFQSHISAQNLLVSNCGDYLVGNFGGGTYEYIHCTFSNEPNFFVRDAPSVQISDNLLLPEGTLESDLNLSIINSIVWGVEDLELLVSTTRSGSNVLLATNLIKSDLPLSNNFTSAGLNFPGFLNPFQFDYSLDSLAFPRGQGQSSTVDIDILGKERDALPDLGAYEF